MSSAAGIGATLALRVGTIGGVAVPGSSKTSSVVVLGLAQIIAWASSYYLLAILAPAIARDLATTVPWVFAAFSLALVVSAIVAPISGRLIDRHGGRPVLIATNVVFAAGLGILASAGDRAALFLGWAVIGLAMGAGLYEAAFAAVVRLYGAGSRRAVTGITLIAGFASTIGWPLSAWLETRYGWRGTCFAWAALHVLVGVPLHLLVPRARTASPAPALPAAAAGAPSATRISPAHVLLAVVFAIVWFNSTAMAAHFPAVIEASGASLAAAVAVGALIGPAQVAGRLLEFGVLQRVHPLLSARLAALAHPVGAVALLALGAGAAGAFAVLHGAANGILTVAMGTLPLVLFGDQGYGARQGMLMLPARVVQAFAPLLFGMALGLWGERALLVSSGLALVAFAALLALRPR